MNIQPSDLKKLAKEHSSEVRAEVAQKIAAEFAAGGFEPNEKRVAIEIFRILANDMETRVRQILSTELAGSMEAPHDVIIKLAHDISEIALPVLQNSYVLTENDLIEITQKSEDVSVMSAIASRDMVSLDLSDALVKKSNIKVVEKLLQNKSANISDSNLQNIYDLSADNYPVLDLMAKRGNIPVDLAEKLFVVVSDEVKNILTKKYNISFKIADDSVKYARELATLGLIDKNLPNMDVVSLVNHLYKNGRLGLSIIIRSLCFGHMRFFEHAIAKLAGIPVINVKILILDRGIGFESLYKKTQLPMEMFLAISYLLKIALDETGFGRFQRNDFKQRLSDRLSRDPSANEIEYMDYIMTIIKNNAPEDGK